MPRCVGRSATSTTPAPTRSARSSRSSRAQGRELVLSRRRSDASGTSSTPTGLTDKIGAERHLRRRRQDLIRRPCATRRQDRPLAAEPPPRTAAPTTRGAAEPRRTSPARPGGGAQRIPPAAHAAWQPAPDRPDPVALLEEQARDADPRARPGPLRPDGRLAVRLLPRRRAADGRRPRRHPDERDHGPALRRRPPLATSGCSRRRSATSFRHQRLRRDPPRAMGVGPQAARGAASSSPAGRAASTPTRRRHAATAAVRSYRTRMAEYAAMRAIDVYYARVDIATVLGLRRRSGRGRYLQSTVKSAAHHDALHELPKLTAVGPDGRRRIVDRPPVITHPARARADRSASTPQRLPRRRSRRTAACCSIGTSSSTPRSRSSASGASVSAAFAALSRRRRRRRPAVPPGQGGRGIGARAVPRAERASRSHGERVVTGQRRLQAASDILLGWTIGRAGRHCTSASSRTRRAARSSRR